MALLTSAITGRHVHQADARYQQQHRQQSYYADVDVEKTTEPNYMKQLPEQQPN